MKNIYDELKRLRKPDGTVNLPAVLSGESAFKDFFGYIPPITVASGGQLVETKSELNNLVIKNPRLYDNFHDASINWWNLWLEGDIIIPGEGRWRDYGFLAETRGKVSGNIEVYEEYCAFHLRAVLNDAVLQPNLQFSLLLYSDILQPTADSGAMLEIMLELEELPATAFVTELFQQKNYWWLKTAFSEGLGGFDIVNFFVKLFGLKDGSALLLPPDSPLNHFKLYELMFGMDYTDTEGLSMRHIQAYLETDKPWNLPLNFLTLDYVRLYWELQWGSDKSGGRSFLYTGRIGAGLTISFPGGMKLTLSGQAKLPDLVIEAHLSLRQEQQQVRGIFGDAAASLPDSSGAELKLLNLDVVADCRNRELSVYTVLQAGSALRFNLGNLEISLARLYAEADFTQSGNTYALGGEIDFGNQGNNPDSPGFSLALKGTYVQPGTGSGYWSFRGSLCRGAVSLGTLVRHMLKLEPGSGGPFDLVLSEFDVSYNTLNHDFSLLAAFYAQWGSIADNLPVRSAGRVCLRSAGGRNVLSIMLALEIPPFMASVQIDDFPGSPAYTFRFAYRERALLAVYENQVLSAALENVSLGDVIAFLIELANPNRVVKFSPPWDFLNKIDLSKFSFVYHFKEKSLSVHYRLDLNIIGLFRLNSIGLTYTKDEKVLFSLDTGETGSNKAYEWDLLESSTPGMVDTQNKFKLHYLAVAQHVSDSEGRLGGMNTIREAVEYLADGNPRMAYSAGANWLFAADFTINDVFRARAILLDPCLYGVAITIDGQKPPFGSFDGLMLELLYKKVAQNVGMFRATLVMPEKYRHFSVGYAALTIGRMSIEIYTNGDFKIDMGFPHNLDFSQSFALEFGIFSGSGGFYFGLLSGLTCPLVPPASSGYYAPVIQLGIGLSIGIGRSFDIGIIRAGFSLQAVGVFEGTLAFYNEDPGAVTAVDSMEQADIKPVYFRAVAVLGLTGQVSVTVDLFIITLSASVAFCAYVQVAYETGKPTLIDLDLELTLQASIKIVFFTIHFEYKLKLHKQICIDGVGEACYGCNLGSYRGKDKLALKLDILPYFSLRRTAPAEHEYVLAFLPVMDNEDFGRLTARMTEWVQAFPVSGDADYETICAFLRDNVEISLRVRNEYKEEKDGAELNGTGKADISGVVFAMPAPVELRVADENGAELARREFWKDNMVADSYIELLHKYFNAFDQEEQPDLFQFSWDSEKPIAQVVFTDYFNMLLRHITKTVKLDGEDAVSGDGLGAMVSRFMLQGLRLPGTDGKDARGLYETLGQQIPFSYTGGGITVEVSCGRPENGWLGGECRTSFSGARLASMLPSLSFSWTDRFSLKAASPFLLSPKSCSVREQVKLGEKVLYRLNGDISEFKQPVLRLGDLKEDADCDFGVLLPFEIRKTGHEDVVQVIGLEPEDRSKLLALCEEAEPGFRVLYSPARMDGVADALMDINAGGEDRFIRQNLTRETRMYAETGIPGNEPVYVTDLENQAFLLMLWRCSVVCGGYHLFLKPHGKPRVPKNIFDEEGRARLWLLVWTDHKAVINCAVSKSAEELGKTAVLLDTASEDWRPAFAPGCFGADARLDCSGCDGGFSVLSYTAPGVEAESRPLVPVEAESSAAESQWRYAPVWPLHRLAGSANPYDAKPVTFTFRLRDVLGNYAAGSVDYTAVPETGDFVIGAHEWPGTRLTWRAVQKSLIQVTLSCMEPEKPAGADSLAIVRRALYQTGQKGYRVSVNGHLLEGAATYLKQLLAYMEEPAGMPAPKELSVLFSPELDDITPLEFSLVIQRDSESKVEKASRTESRITPHIAPDLPSFAREFETAFPGYKLARAGEGQGYLTAIRAGEEGLKLSVKAYERGGMKLPTYYSFRPLCNTPVTRECLVTPWGGERAPQVFADIDVEVWARHLLEDMDLLLSPDFAVILGVCPALPALIGLKEQLARNISLQFIPLEENAPDAAQYQIALVQAWVLEQLRVSLSDGYDISSAAQYRSCLSAASPSSDPAAGRIRLALSAGGNGGMSVFSGKADTESDIICIGYRMANHYQTGIFPQYDLRAGQLEYHIKDMGEGYQSSDWMQMILPLQSPDISLASDVPVPNPLRQIPGKSELVKHTCSLGERCCQWDYHLRLQTSAAEQDVLCVGITFQNTYAGQSAQEQDLFDALAQYETVRQPLLQAITKSPDTYLPVFNQYVKDAAERWNGPLLSDSLSGAGETLEFEISIKLEGGHAALTLDGYDASVWTLEAFAVTKEVKPGEMFELEVVVKNLPVYSLHCARPKMYCVRNSKLLGKLKVKDAFIYRTGDHMLPMLYAFTKNRNITCGIIPKLDKTNILKAQALAAKTLGFCASDCHLDIVVRYQYGFGTSVIRLPVCMFLSVDMGDFAGSEDIAGTVAAWYQRVMPIMDKAALEFEFHVAAGERAVAEFSNVTVQILAS